MTAPYQPSWHQPDAAGPGAAGPGAAGSGAGPGLPDRRAAGADWMGATSGAGHASAPDPATPDAEASGVDAAEAGVLEPAAPGSAEQGPTPGDPHTALARELAAAAAGLGDVDGLPVGEHVARYDAVHATLQDALTSIDTV